MKFKTLCMVRNAHAIASHNNIGNKDIHKVSLKQACGKS